MELGELYETYAKMIYRFIYLKCKDANVAEDIVQTTFLKAITGINSFKGDSQISTWLCRIAKNEYINYLKKNRSWKSLEDYPKETAESLHRDLVLEKIIAHEQATTAKQLLDALEEPYRDVFIMRVFAEYSFVEIAEVYGKTDTWARVTYYRARKKMEDGLKKREGNDEV